MYRIELSMTERKKNFISILIISRWLFCVQFSFCKIIKNVLCLSDKQLKIIYDYLIIYIITHTKTHQTKLFFFNIVLTLIEENNLNDMYWYNEYMRIKRVRLSKQKKQTFVDIIIIEDYSLYRDHFDT